MSTTTAFLPKDVANKMNLLLYRILDEQILISSKNICFGYLTNIQNICFFIVLNSCMLPLKRRFRDSQIVIISNYVVVSSVGIKRFV